MVGLQEDFDLGDGWKLLVREDKKDRFTLIRTGPKMESDEVAQVPHASFLECASGAPQRLTFHTRVRTHTTRLDGVCCTGIAQMREQSRGRGVGGEAEADGIVVQRPSTKGQRRALRRGAVQGCSSSLR